MNKLSIKKVDLILDILTEFVADSVTSEESELAFHTVAVARMEIKNVLLRYGLMEDGLGKPGAIQEELNSYINSSKLPTPEYEHGK